MRAVLVKILLSALVHMKHQSELSAERGGGGGGGVESSKLPTDVPETLIENKTDCWFCDATETF